MQPYRYSRRLWAALLAEFIGMAIFQIYGGSANDEVAAFGNGLTLAVVSKRLSSTSCSFINVQLQHIPLYCMKLPASLTLWESQIYPKRFRRYSAWRVSHSVVYAAVYATANVSGGHVNPAVTLANCLTGHTSWGRGGLYMLAQLLGAIFGALIEASHFAHLQHQPQFHRPQAGLA